MFLQLQSSFTINDNRFVTFDDLVDFCLSKQPEWSNWKRVDLEKCIAAGLNQRLVFWVSTGHIVESVVIARRKSKIVEVLQFCGNFKRHGEAFIRLCKVAHPAIDRMTYVRNTRHKTVKFDNILRHL